MTPLEKVRAELDEYLKTPESFPLVVANTPAMMNTLIRQAFKQKDRRFHPEPETPTSFGELP